MNMEKRMNFLRPRLSLVGRMALCAALLLTGVACDKPLENNGPRTAAQFVLQVTSFGSESTVTRAGATADRVLETVEIPLEHNRILSVALVEEAATPARSAHADGVTPGAYIYIVAYDGGTVADSQLYTYGSDGSLTPVADPITLTCMKSYRFVAYSYNDATTPPPTPTNGSIPGISPKNHDLLWGATGDIVFAGSGTAINILLNHKFMRFKYQPPEVTGATITLDASYPRLTTNYEGNLTLSSGLLATAGPAGWQTLDTDDYVMAYPAQPVAGTTNTFSILLSGTIESNNKTSAFDALPVAFKQELAAGGSYTLQINFVKTLGWAGSNVYWDQDLETLMFKPAGTPITAAEQKYMGVMFKWGSLVGISPQHPKSGSDYLFNNNTTPLFWPTYTGDPATCRWDETTAAAKTITWATIPSVDPHPGTYGTNTDYFRNNPSALYSSQRGDICRYLGAVNPTSEMAGYRMPTHDELMSGGGLVTYDQSIYQNAATLLNNYWTSSDGSAAWSDVTQYAATNRDGTYPVQTGSYNGVNAFFPATGWCDRIAAVNLEGVGVYGHYWSASIADDIESYYIVNANTLINPRITDPRSSTGHAFFVRCVRDE
jgi:hypothetical protein